MARKIFSNLFAFGFVLVFVLFLIVAPIKSSLLNPDFYKTAFDKSDFYGQFTKVVPPIFNALTQGNLRIGPLGPEEIGQILNESIKPEFLKGQIENALDQFFSFAYKKTTALEIIIPLGDFKKSAAENFNKSLHAKLESLPPCTAEQLQKLQTEEGATTLFDCKIEGVDLGELEKALSEAITGSEGLLTKLPDQYNATETLSKNPTTLKKIQDFFRAFNIIFWGLLIASGFLLLLLVLLNIKYLPGMLKWISIPAIIASLPILLFGLIGKILIPALATGFLTKLTPETKTLATSLISNFASSLSFYFILYSGIALAIAVILLVLGIILGMKFPKGGGTVKGKETAAPETPEDKAAKKGFVLALIGFLLGLIPFLPMFLNGLAIPFSWNGMAASSPRKKLATAGFIIAIIGLIWNIIFSIGVINSAKKSRQAPAQNAVSFGFTNKNNNPQFVPIRNLGNF